MVPSDCARTFNRLQGFASNQPGALTTVRGRAHDSGINQSTGWIPKHTIGTTDEGGLQTDGTNTLKQSASTTEGICVHRGVQQYAGRIVGLRDTGTSLYTGSMVMIKTSSEVLHQQLTSRVRELFHILLFPFPCALGQVVVHQPPRLVFLRHIQHLGRSLLLRHPVFPHGI